MTTRSRRTEPRPGGPRLTRSVARGVHRLSHAHVNCYLLVDGDDVTIVDAAFPATWRVLPDALAAIGRRLEDVHALVLTHAHFDHLGFARRLHQERGVPVYAHPAEEYLLAHPYRYAHESPRLVYPIWYPRAIPLQARMLAAGALGVHGVDDSLPIAAGERLDVPGHPESVFSPGHTFGHTAFRLEDADAVLTGDALVTLDPYTAATGPRVVAGAATADLDEAFRSLDVLAEQDARIVLPGHGEPWFDGIVNATDAARRAGPS